MLSKGPKFCLNVKPSRLDVAASIFKVSSRLSEQSQASSFVDQAIKRLNSVVDASFKTDRRDFGVVRRVASHLEEKDLVVLQTDKTGCFGVLTRTDFDLKRSSVVTSLFRSFDGSIDKLKRQVIRVLRDEQLHQVAKRVSEAARDSLSVKFLLKDHKIEMPLRVVVNENLTWQKVVSRFIQKCLSTIPLENPLRLRNTEELVSNLVPLHGKRAFAVSMDIKDLYYSLEESILLPRVRTFLESKLTQFQSAASMSVTSFMRILELYLRSTVVLVDGKLVNQRNGVCIGSAIAPLLAEIYLHYLDDAVSSFLNMYVLTGTALVKRFVDDLCILSTDESVLETIIVNVKKAAPELCFTVEYPVNGMLQFLDLKLILNTCLCWEYGKVSSKPVLPASSCHSKNVKSGVMRSLFSNAFKRSCEHRVGFALGSQLQRVVRAGYRDGQIGRSLFSSLFALFEHAVSESNTERKPIRVVVPFFHAISHNLKAVASKFNIQLVFSNDFRLDRLTPFTGQKPTCKSHRAPVLPCQSNVLYDIPMACGFRYIGQTSRCVNDRIREHIGNVKRSAPNSEIVKHLLECNNCEPLWESSLVLGKEPNDLKRLLRETAEICGSGNCLSRPSLVYTAQVKEFLFPFPHR